MNRLLNPLPNVLIVSRVPLLNKEWVLETLQDFSSDIGVQSRALWRVRFIQRRRKGHTVCCMIGLHAGKKPVWSVGSGMDEYSALWDCLEKVELGIRRQFATKHSPW